MQANKFCANCFYSIKYAENFRNSHHHFKEIRLAAQTAPLLASAAGVGTELAALGREAQPPSRNTADQSRSTGAQLAERAASSGRANERGQAKVERDSAITASNRAKKRGRAREARSTTRDYAKRRAAM